MPVRISRWAVLALALGPVTAVAATPADPYQFELKVAPGDGAALKTDADFSARFSDLETSLRLAVAADPGASPADPLTSPASTPYSSREAVSFKAAWSGLALGRIELSAGDALSQAWNAPSWFGAGGRQTDSDNRNLALALVVSPRPTRLGPVDLTVTGTAAQSAVLDRSQTQAVSPEAQSRFATAVQGAGAQVNWKPVPWLKLDVDGRVETTGLQWRGAPAGGAAAAASLNYAFFEPSVGGDLSLPRQAKLGVVFEHAVSPIDPQAFSTLAELADRADIARYGPNREWRTRVSFAQTLPGAVKVSADLTKARIESATELGPVAGGLQAPVSVAGGARQEVKVAVSAPLAALGLASFTLKGTGAWRDSQIRDPFTGELRRPSSETPQTATVGLEQALPGQKAKWGLEGRFGGDQSLYQMSQVTNISVADSVGGFVEYAPGAFALRLQVDGLYGGDRTYTDTYYAGARGLGAIDRTDRRTDSNQAVRLILRKTLG